MRVRESEGDKYASQLFLEALPDLLGAPVHSKGASGSHTTSHDVRSRPGLIEAML